YSIGFSPAAVKKAVSLQGFEVGESRYAVQFSAEEQQQIRQIVNHYLQ
ncbi:MAG: dihydrodipicolinate synthase family protein, partial [Pantoea agglomerans]